MTAYYNEIDPSAAAWLRELIAEGHIAPGVVDTRSILDVRPQDLEGFSQCHFFAGIGVWSYALRLAGWPDNRPVWTASCPCQPFSSSGRRNGFDDERHLWPALQWLVGQCAPPVVLGEQVASKAAEPWFDLVQADLEALGYAFGCVAFPSAGVGAPHIRDRAYWVAHGNGTGLAEQCGASRPGELRETARLAEGNGAGRLADDQKTGREQLAVASRGGKGRAPEGLEQRTVGGCAVAGGVGDAIRSGRQSQPARVREHGEGVGSPWREQERSV